MSKYAYRILDLDFSGAKVNELQDIEGQVITYISGTPDITIRLNSRSQDAITISTKDRLKLPSGMSFKKFYVSGASGGGVVQLLVGRPDLMVDAGQVYIAGTVNAEDEAALIQAGGGNYFNHFNNIAGVAGEYSVIGVYNPVGSGINAYVDWFMSAYHLVATHALKADIHGINDVSNLTHNTTTPLNRQLGGAAPNAEACFGSLTAAELAAQSIGKFDFLFETDGKKTESRLIRTPYCIPEGFGLIMVHQDVAGHLIGAFSWLEI